MRMRRTDKLNIAIRPDLKDGFKELVSGELISNAFERIVTAYVKQERDINYTQCVGMSEALKKYLSDPNYSKAVEISLKSEIDKYREEVERLDNVAEMMGIDI